MDLRFAASPSAADAVIVFAFDAGDDPAPLAELSTATNGGLDAARRAQRFTGKDAQVAVLFAPAGVEADRIVLVGLGKREALDGGGIERGVAGAVRGLLVSGAKSALVRLDGLGLDPDAAGRAGLGARLAASRFDQHRTKLAEEKKPTLKKLSFVVDDPKKTKTAWERYEPVADGVDLARRLVAEPANVMFPAAVAEEAKALEDLGVEVEILGEKAMAALGMNALLGVGRGSRKESQLVVMRWKGGGGKKPLALVGKGVCFDSGGLNVKVPWENMKDMKGDMGGAAAVIGAMRAIAGRKAKADVTGIVGLVENMPDGDAQRPGDIVTSMNGQTIEILNTDAEGRLVLADALCYAVRKEKAKSIIDLATLTGAIIISLGHEHAGLFSNDDKLATALTESGLAAGEPVWRLPLGRGYDKLLDSENADMKNVGGAAAGSITAAQFLQRFVEDTPWAHLDIASTAWKDRRDDPREPLWATGFGVRLLDRYVG